MSISSELRHRIAGEPAALVTALVTTLVTALVTALAAVVTALVCPVVFALVVASAATSHAQPAAAASPSAARLDLSFDEFTLPNGLRVVVHTDRKAPVVAVSVWYHVGSKEEQEGRTGLAHLFEHLMFQSSEHRPGEYTAQLAAVGATEMDGTTNFDRTNFFQSVPTTALDTALWMESDRMGHLLGAVEQAALEQQRGVVQNEKRQLENQPYGRFYPMLFGHSFPPGHPYHRHPIGSMADLDAATLDDVKSWLRSWYGPNNAVLVLAGDLDVAVAKEKVLRFFGDLPPSAAVRKQRAQLAARTKPTRVVMRDRVPRARVTLAWNIPQAGAAAADRLQLVAQLFGGSRSSRLAKRLVLGEALADSVTAETYAYELAGLFVITAEVKEGVAPAKVEAAIREELAGLLTAGPTRAEVARAQAALTAGLLSYLEKVGGLGGKADTLGRCAALVGRTDCFRAALAHHAAATPVLLRDTARAWLRRGDLTLVITPGERAPVQEETAVVAPPRRAAAPARGLRASPGGVDRSKGAPQPASFPALRYPALHRTRLRNGLKVVVAERPGAPLLQLQLMFRGAGFTADPAGQEGSATFAMQMLGEGAGGDAALAFGERVEALGAELVPEVAPDASSLRLSALADKRDEALALLADAALRPQLREPAIERVRAQLIAAVQQQKGSPAALAGRLAPALLLGAGHPYGKVPGGSEASLRALGRAELLAWQARWLRPEHATLIVVGSTTLAALLPELEARFGGWQASGAGGSGGAAPVSPPLPGAAARPRLFLVDQPGSLQASIHVAQVLPPEPAAQVQALAASDLASAILGGDFASRINRNLREDKGWTYRASAWLSRGLGPLTWNVSTAVQLDKAAEAMKEIERELRELATGKAPITALEMQHIRPAQVLALPGSFETAAAVRDSIADLELYGRPDDYEAARAAAIQGLTEAQVQAAARQIFQPDALVWIVVGDLRQLEASIRALGLGAVKVLDADGKVLR